jgi:hypothetical protein
MKTWKKFLSGLALCASLTPSLWAQVQAPPVPVPPPTPAPTTLWSFLGLTFDQKQACKDKLCQTPIGQLLNNSLMPIGALSGGLLGSCCPPASAADLLKPADSAEGAAARIKASEADAKARRAAVRYLGTVDCNWWPEAKDALIAALRADKNECVRLEAAWALTSGCCCTKETIDALTETVNGGKKIGPSPENSERVKQAAAVALERCLACLPPTPAPAKGPEGGIRPPEGTRPPEGAPKPPAELPKNMTDAGSPMSVHLAAHFAEVQATPMSQLVERANQALADYRRTNVTAMARPASSLSDHSLYGILVNARHASHAAKNSDAVAMTQAAPAVAKTSEVAQIGVPMKMRTRGTDAAVVLPAGHLAPPIPANPPPAGTQDSDAAKVQEWIGLLNTSEYPELREYAVGNLATFDWRANPPMVQALLTGARKDPSVAVRIACIRCLAKSKVNVPQVQTAMREMQVDTNANIREAAHLALVSLTSPKVK